ncbi:hypothetical protein WMF04_12585 [Sorangium sp. So ce260]|uniref:hypothetical protein n=1 Tax=Sorangium sp. So ce260 TaxID=3133291 RepID=UPI003F5EBB50
MTAPPCPSLLRAAVLAARPCSSAALARSLGAAALAVSATGCLVISPPEYEHPEQTAPVLTAVFPPPHMPVYINEEQILFGATVLSEDDGDPVQVALYIDYGKRTRAGKPFRRIVGPWLKGGTGTIAGGQRPFTFGWVLDEDPLPTDGMTPERECHTITMVASHAFDSERCNCPTDPDDTSWLTWQVINCDPNEPTCPTLCPALNCEATPCIFCDDPSLQKTCTSPGAAPED